MSYTVLLTDDVARDLESLYDYVFEHDSPEKADHLLKKIEQAFSKLTSLPHRGTYPAELSELGNREYRQVFFKPYRVIYRVIGKSVYIYLISDGRPDMQTLLNQRLLSH